MGFFSRRKHQRFSCDLPARLYRAGTIDFIGDCRISSLSMGGASIETKAPLQIGEEYDLRLAWKGRRRRLSSKLAWREKGSFGLSFHPRSRQDAFVKSILDDIRRVQQEISPSLERTIRNYWDI